MNVLLRFLLCVLLSLTGAAAGAAPFLTADPVSSSPAGPTSTAFRIDGGAWATGCVWSITGATKTFFCDLAGTNTAPGTRSYEAKYIYNGGCDTSVTPEVCVPAGEAIVANPLSVVWKAPGAPTGTKVVPSSAP